jgi:hypothetical protein
MEISKQGAKIARLARGIEQLEGVKRKWKNMAEKH